MRITNPMITSSMLLNINRNANGVNKYYNQLATGKQITVPSDDPLRATRALKFRTNVAETEQYLKNVSQGLSWTEVTEAAFVNINNILLRVRELSERGATDTLTYEDREKVMANITSLVEQIGLEMNVTYAGRYVFSGYRTDQPPVLTEDDPSLSYLGVIQYFSSKDIEFTTVYSRDLTVSPGPPPTTGSAVLDVAVIKLAYANLTQTELGGTGGAYTVVSINPSDPDYDANAYAAGNYIKETGEIVLAAQPRGSAASLPSAASLLASLTTDDYLTVTYDILTEAAGGRGGLKKGELNPQIYFYCRDNTYGSPTGPEKDPITGDYDDGTGMVFNPEFDPIANPPNGARQHFEYEFSVGTRVRVNSNAPDVLTDKMYADYQAMLARVKYVNELTKEQVADRLVGISEEYYEDVLAQEMQKIQIAMQENFSNLLGLCDSHLATVSVEHTDLGSRMNRLELIQTRLEEDRISYTKLLSDNEDVDYAEALMRLSSLQAVYQASLKTGAGIMKLTLADYI